MKKHLAFILLTAAVFICPMTYVSAQNQSNSGDVTYVETTKEQLNDEDWERENDPLYEQYNAVSARTAINTTSARTSITTAWGSGLKHDPRFADCKRIYGVDVSKWQKTIDWKKAKAAGVEFAILRLGYRAQATGTLTLDEYFDQNIKGAYEAGIKVGVYFYTQAITKAEAKAEAQFCVKKLSNYQGYLSFPIMYDIENTSTDRMGKAKVTTDQRTTFCKAFCDEAIANGYKSGVYASLAYFQNNLKPATFSSEYHNWLARYASAYNYNGKQYDGDYEIWQYTSTGKVNGISGNVDLDVYYAKTPDKVSDISMTANTTSSIQLSWKKQDAVNGYEICVYDGNEQLINTLYSETESISIGNLTSGTTYKFTVRAYFTESEIIYGSYSNIAAFATKPDVVTGISMSSYSANSITLKWNPVNGATAYRVYLYDSTSKTYKLYATTTKKSYTIKKLTKNKKYFFKVQAYRKVDSRVYEGLTSSRFQGATKPDKVTNLKKNINTSNAISLTWKKQNGVTGYRISCYDSKGKLYSETFTKGNVNKIGVKKLEAGKVYTFKVSSYISTNSGNVYGTQSSGVSMTTKPAKVVEVGASTTTKNSITLKWKQVTGATGYKVYSYNTRTKKARLIATAKKNSYKVSKLKAANKYSYIIKAYKNYSNKTYYGAKSNYVTISTAPDKVVNLKAKKNSANSITLTWKKVAGASGYRIYKYDAEGNLLDKFDTTKTKYTNTKLTKGEYTYSVRAYVRTKDRDSFGSYSEECDVKIK